MCREGIQKNHLRTTIIARRWLSLWVEIMGFEPMTSCMPCKRSSQLSYTPFFKVEMLKAERVGKCALFPLRCKSSTFFVITKILWSFFVVLVFCVKCW